jgi:hypothetical protein
MVGNDPHGLTLDRHDFWQRTFTQEKTRFSFRHPAEQAYLLLADAAGNVKALERMALSGDRWILTLLLSPGTYRYRYYVTKGGAIVHLSPADAQSDRQVIHLKGMDAVFDAVDSSEMRE